MNATLDDLHRQHDAALGLDPDRLVFLADHPYLERSRNGVVAEVERRGGNRDWQVSHLILPNGTVAETADWGLSTVMAGENMRLWAEHVAAHQAACVDCSEVA